MPSIIRSISLAFSIVLLTCGCGEERSQDLVKGQSNTSMVFYGLAVDQNNVPVANMRFQVTVEAFPADWTFETRGAPNQRMTLSTISDAEGRFQLDITGCVLFIKPDKLDGYRHFTSLSGSQMNTAYQLINTGDLWYKSDPDNPAVYVFVRDGVKEVSALPSRGGFDSGGGTVWRRNEPAWPKKPSFPDVVYKPPTTPPATTRSSGG